MGAGIRFVFTNMDCLLAFAYVVVVPRFVNKAAHLAIISFFAGISYEIYLVHAPFVVGKLQLVKLDGISGYVTVPCALALVVSAAVLVHILSGWIRRFSEPRLAWLYGPRNR
jgi:peptidoglycan/LPS O-acetylase OafA/YrhL